MRVCVASCSQQILHCASCLTHVAGSCQRRKLCQLTCLNEDIVGSCEGKIVRIEVGLWDAEIGSPKAPPLAVKLRHVNVQTHPKANAATQHA